VTPINQNLVRGTLATAVNPTGNPRAPSIGSAFPFACCGGLAAVSVTTTFTAGDNNIFGPFTRTTTCTIDLGFRAPVVKSVTPSGPIDCAFPQDLLISGFCFILPNGTANVTSVFAVELGNPANRINAISFVILSPNLIDADFNFGSANAGKTFLIFVEGPNGRSRNLLSTDPRPAGCPIGNEDGIQVTFRCQAVTPPPGSAPTIVSAVVDGNVVIAEVDGWQQGATFLFGDPGVSPRKIKVKGQTTVGSSLRTRFVLKGGICGSLPGRLVVINPGSSGQSQPFQISGSCQ
jgi:hypothetical protein